MKGLGWCGWFIPCCPGQRDERTFAQRQCDRLYRAVDRIADDLDTGDDDMMVALWRVKQAAEAARRLAYRPLDLRGGREPLMYAFATPTSPRSPAYSDDYQDALGRDGAAGLDQGRTS